MDNENGDILQDKRYKFYKALAEEPAFRKKIAALKLRLSVFGHPIPTGGFPDEKAADLWTERVHKDHYNRIKSDRAYIKKERAITNGRNALSLIESNAVDALRKEELPPNPYFEPLLEILDPFIKNRERDIHDFTFIKNLVLREKIVYQPTILTTNLKLNKEGEFELWVRIHPTTRKKDLNKYWPKIAEAQKYLPGFEQRFRKSPALETDADGLTPEVSKATKSRIRKRLG